MSFDVIFVLFVGAIAIFLFFQGQIPKKKDKENRL